MVQIWETKNMGKFSLTKNYNKIIISKTDKRN